MEVVEHHDDRPLGGEVPEERAGGREGRVGALEVAERGSALVERGRTVGQLAERQEGDPLAVRGARGIEHDGANVVREDRDEAALADSRLAHDDDVAGLLGVDHALERRSEARELLRAPDQRREIFARPRADRAHAEETAVGVQLERVAAQARGDRGELNLVRCRVAERTPRAAHRGADEHGRRAVHEQPPGSDREPRLDVPPAQELPDLDPRAGRPDDVVLVRAVGAERSDELDTRFRRERAAVPRDDVGDRPADVPDDRTRGLELEVVVEERLDEEQRDRPSHRADRRHNRLRGGKRGILREDHPVERAGLGGGLESPLLDERMPRRLVGVERLLLPPRPEVRKHQETAEPLAIRVLRGQPGGVGNHVVVPAELDLGLDAILERRQPELVEPRDLPLEEALVREVGEWRSAPERQRVAEGGRALGGRQRPRIMDEPLEAAGVDHARLRAERIPAGARLDRLLPERVPQTRNGVLHDRFCRRRRPTRPEVVDQRVPRDHRARMQHQIGEHRTLPWTAERDAPFARANLQRAEHEKRGGVVRHGRVRRRYSSSSQKYREGS